MTRRSAGANPWAVCSEIIRDGCEYDRRHEWRILHTRSPRSRAAIEEDLRVLDESPRPSYRGRYAPQLLQVLARLPLAPSETEIVRLVMLRLQVILLKSWTTDSTINGSTTDQERAALSYMRRTIFGAGAFYQGMDVGRGPLGMSFAAHGVRLGVHDAARLGPFTRLGVPVKTRGSTQQLSRWLACRTLPGIGWFSPRRRTPEEASAISRDLVEPGNLVKPPVDTRLDRYLERYPWARFVKRGDGAVYKVSRILSRCVRLLMTNRQRTLQDAFDIMRPLLVPDPLDEEIVLG